MTVRSESGFLFDVDEQDVLALAELWAHRQFPLERFDGPDVAMRDWVGFANSGLLDVREEDTGPGRDFLYCGIAYEMGRLLAAESYVANSLVVELLRSDPRSGLADSRVLDRRQGPIYVAYVGGDHRLASVFGTARPDALSGVSAGAHGLIIDDAQVAVAAPSGDGTLGEHWPAAPAALDLLPDMVIVSRHRHDIGALVDDRTYIVALLARASGLAGAGADVLTRTVDHVLRRNLFGKTLGSFQTVKHRIAGAEVALTAARATIRAACLSGNPRRARAAWRLAADAAIDAASAATQLHGGLGVSWEMPIHLYAKSIYRQAWSALSPASAGIRLADLTEAVREVPV